MGLTEADVKALVSEGILSADYDEHEEAIEFYDKALKIIEKQPRGAKRLLKPVFDYQYDNVSEKVVRIILSYIDYINKNVWKK